MRIPFLAFSFHVLAASSMASTHLRGRAVNYGSEIKIESGSRRLIGTEYMQENMKIGDSITRRVDITIPNDIIFGSLDLCLLQESKFTNNNSENKAKWLKSGTTAQDIYSSVKSYISDSAFAVAEFIDYNIAPYGNSFTDYVYKLLSTMSTDEDNWEMGINAMNELGHGLDTPQAQYDAIVFAAGNDSDPSFPVYTPSDPSDIGPQQPCGWRLDPEANKRIMVVVTDSPFHVPSNDDPPPPYINDHNSTVAALDNQKISIIGLTTESSLPELQNLATATGGSVQTLFSNGSNYVDALMDGIRSFEPSYDSVTSNYSVLNDDTDALDIVVTPPSVTNVLPGSDVSFLLTLHLEDDPEQSAINATVRFYLDNHFFHDLDITVIVDTATNAATPTPKSLNGTAKKIIHEYTEVVSNKHITETSSTNKTTIVEEELLS